MLTDQLVYGPLQNALFISFLAAVVEGRGAAATLARLRGDLPSVQSRGWRFWPVVSFVNQEFIPLKVGVRLEPRSLRPRAAPLPLLHLAGTQPPGPLIRDCCLLTRCLQLRVLWLNLAALGWSTFLILQGKGGSKVVMRPKLAAR